MSLAQEHVGQPGGYGAPPEPGSSQEWMPIPRGIRTDCPSGLEYLAALDELLVKQSVTMCSSPKKYLITNSIGQKIFYAIEDTCWATRLLCRAYREFDLKFLDSSENEVMSLHRPCTVVPCFMTKIDVHASPRTLLGRVKLNCSFCAPKFSVENASGLLELRIQGPMCIACCCCGGICGDVNYKVIRGGTQIGTIAKQWSGCIKETFTSADNFKITFPMNLDVNMKATLLGACFLIDFMIH